MRLITLAIHSLLLISLACTQKPYRGLDIYHKFYELPTGLLKIFYCEIGNLRDVRVEYKDRNVSEFYTLFYISFSKPEYSKMLPIFNLE